MLRNLMKRTNRRREENTTGKNTEKKGIYE